MEKHAKFDLDFEEENMSEEFYVRSSDDSESFAEFQDIIRSLGCFEDKGFL